METETDSRTSIENLFCTLSDGEGRLVQLYGNCIRATHLLTSELGWTRWFFGKPWENKSDLNALVAHAPQNLNVGIINQSFSLLWNLEKRTAGDFKILAQIHDSIPFQYKEGRIDLAIEAARLMERKFPIKDCKGKTREMLIPIKLKAEGKRWSELVEIKDWRN